MECNSELPALYYWGPSEAYAQEITDQYQPRMEIQGLRPFAASFSEPEDFFDSLYRITEETGREIAGYLIFRKTSKGLVPVAALYTVGEKDRAVFPALPKKELYKALNLDEESYEILPFHTHPPKVPLASIPSPQDLKAAAELRDFGYKQSVLIAPDGVKLYGPWGVTEKLISRPYTYRYII